MNYNKVKYAICMLVVIGLMLLASLDIEAKAKKPYPYTIANPHIVEKNHKVTIEWNQTQPVYVVLYKLSYRRILNNNCPSDINTFGAYCTIVWQAVGFKGIVHKTDKNFRGGDEYYIQQNVYQSHNGGYGPFIPTYR